MHCPTHGDLPTDWSSCPYCLRGTRPSSGQYQTTGIPPAPSFQGYGMDDTARTRGSGAAGATQGASMPGADVTRNAGAGGSPFVSFGAGTTRIVDAPPSKRKIRAWLIEKEGPRPDQLWQVGDDVTWIGRDRRNQICIDDDTISTQHVKLWVDDDRALRMLNVSTSNGTRVNGVRVEAPVELVENDEIQLGAVVLVLKRLDTPRRTAAPNYAPNAYASAPAPSGYPPNASAPIPSAAPPTPPGYPPSTSYPSGYPSPGYPPREERTPPTPFGPATPTSGDQHYMEPTVPLRSPEGVSLPQTERVPSADPTLWLKERRTP